MLLHTLIAAAACLALHAAIAPFLRAQNTSARAHYVICLATVAAYAAAYPYGPEVFCAVYLPVMAGQYVYDLVIIAADRARLRRSYVRFYVVHHVLAFAVLGMWVAAFDTFTPAMAIGGLLFMSSDVWRWLQQLAHLSGRASTERQRLAVFWMERAHRLVCYGAGAWTIGAGPWLFEEVVFCSSAVLMDVVDTTFQVKAMARRRSRTPQAPSVPLAELAA